MLHYSVLLQRDSERLLYGATVPSLPRCFTHGATVGQALEGAREAISLHLEGYVERREPILVQASSSLLTLVEVDVPQLAAT